MIDFKTASAQDFEPTSEPNRVRHKGTGIGVIRRSGQSIEDLISELSADSAFAAPASQEQAAPQMRGLAIGQFPLVDMGGYLDLTGWEGQAGIGFAFRADVGEYWFILSPEPSNYVAMVDSFPRGAELSPADVQPGMFVVRVKDATGTPFDPECVRISVSGVTS